MASYSRISKQSIINIKAAVDYNLIPLKIIDAQSSVTRFKIELKGKTGMCVMVMDVKGAIHSYRSKLSAIKTLIKYNPKLAIVNSIRKKQELKPQI